MRIFQSLIANGRMMASIGAEHSYGNGIWSEMVVDENGRAWFASGGVLSPISCSEDLRDLRQNETVDDPRTEYKSVCPDPERYWEYTWKHKSTGEVVESYETGIDGNVAGDDPFADAPPDRREEIRAVYERLEGFRPVHSN